MSDRTPNSVGQAVRDSAYAAVGLGVLAFQRAQVKRQELMRELEGPAGTELRRQVSAACGRLSAAAREVDERLQPARRRLDERMEALEHRVPGPAREAIRTARSAAASSEHLVRSVIGSQPGPQEHAPDGIPDSGLAAGGE